MPIGQIPNLIPRCKGCAFTPGTPANQSRITQLRTTLCVEAYEPFYCHENAVEDQLPAGKEHLCRGWAEAVMGTPAPPEWKRSLSISLLKIVDEFETKPDATEVEIQSAIGQAILEAS